jgi:uncharacterized protein
MLAIIVSLLFSLSDDFLKAVSVRDLATVKAMLESDPSLADAQSAKGVSATLGAMFAIRKGEESFVDPKANDVLQAILARKPKFGLYETAGFGSAAQLDAMLTADPKAVTSRSSFGWTPLHVAAFAGNVANVELLLARGADANARATSKFRNTPLQAALLSGQYATAKVLLERGADVYVRQAEGFTALHEAAQNGREDLVKLLLDHGAEVGARADDGRTALDMAEKKKHEKVIALLKAQAAPAKP